MAAPTAYGGSQARGPIGAYRCQSTPEPQQSKIQATSETYTTAHGNTRSLTHWARGTHVLMEASQVCLPLRHEGSSGFANFMNSFPSCNLLGLGFRTWIMQNLWWSKIFCHFREILISGKATRANLGFPRSLKLWLVNAQQSYCQLQYTS